MEEDDSGQQMSVIGSDAELSVFLEHSWASSWLLYFTTYVVESEVWWRVAWDFEPAHYSSVYLAFQQ